MLEETGNLILRIYDIGTEEPPYVNYGKDAKIGRYSPVVVRRTDTKEELLKIWTGLLKIYEGYAYTIYDIEHDRCIVGGAFDPSDDEIISENLG